MNHIRLFLLVFAVSLMSGCIEEYTSTTEGFAGELTVEGRIVSGEESVIYLSRTVPLNYSSTMVDYVFNADVRIIGDDGFRSEKAENIEDGTYVLNAGMLRKDVRYAVEIKTGGETYLSDFQSLLDTPEIDAVTWKESPEQVSIYVSTTGNGQHYYMWTYEEDWQYHAQKDLNDVSDGVPQYLRWAYPDLVVGKKNPYYYCYAHSGSSSILLYSTTSLTDDSVPKLELVSYGNDAVKLSSLYSILVRQWVLSEDAYMYYSIMKKQVEGSAGLFPVMPVELYGNVHCVSNPAVKVRGYVLASQVTEKRIFINAHDFKEFRAQGYNMKFYDESDKEADGVDENGEPNWIKKWSKIFEKEGGVYYSHTGLLPDAFALYPRNCVDCRELGGTINRPDFWPEGEPNYAF